MNCDLTGFLKKVLNKDGEDPYVQLEDDPQSAVNSACDVKGYTLTHQYE